MFGLFNDNDNSSEVNNETNNVDRKSTASDSSQALSAGGDINMTDPASAKTVADGLKSLFGTLDKVLDTTTSQSKANTDMLSQVIQKDRKSDATDITKTYAVAGAVVVFSIAVVILIFIFKKKGK